MNTPRIILRERTLSLMKKVAKSPLSEQLVFFGIPDNKQLAQEVARINNGQYQNFYSGVYYDLILKENKEVIGSAGFHTWWREHDRAEIGCWLNDAKNRRQGYMNEVFPVLLEYGFKKMKLHRIEAHTALDNTASIAMLKKYGFKLEATIHGRYKVAEGKYEDDYLFYLLEG